MVLLIGFSATDALACMCNPGETEDPLNKAEVAFIGRPIMIEVVPRHKPSTTTWQRIKDSISAMFGSSSTEQALEHPELLDSVRVTFEVSEYIKETGDKQFQVMIGYGGSDCGLPVQLKKGTQSTLGVLTAHCAHRIVLVVQSMFVHNVSRRDRMAANNSFKPTSLRGAV